MVNVIPGWKPIFQGPEYQANLIRPIIEQAGIPVECFTTHGAGFRLQAGSFLEDYWLYVPEAKFEEAGALVKAYIAASDSHEAPPRDDPKTKEEASCEH